MVRFYRRCSDTKAIVPTFAVSGDLAAVANLAFQAYPLLRILPRQNFLAQGLAK
jgi:hypothetical protein